jgi:putative aminopeptidase FrvX
MPRPGYDKNDAAKTPFQAENIEIYLGVTSEAEVRGLGVREGDPVVFKKRIADLSPEIMATRAVDDRAGCAAVLEAALRLDPKRIGGRMITFAWSVQEETGLTGAAKMARTMKPDYVFAVDTFVSSDSPLDDKRFAYAPVGKGAVIRAIDSSSVIPRQELDKLIGIAKNNNIRIQLANSRGGNDGSVFIPGGAVNIPLSWPGAHAHSFIEKIHRADLQALVDLILAVCQEW